MTICSFSVIYPTMEIINQFVIIGNVGILKFFDIDLVILTFISLTRRLFAFHFNNHWGKADDRNCNYGNPKMPDMKLGKNIFCRLNCLYNVF